MLIHECEQGSNDWHRLRLGIPTASCFHRILMPSKLKMSAQANDYAVELASERVTGEPCDMQSSGFMQRGKELEPKAIQLYELMTNSKVRRVGFVTNNEQTIGCSPDDLVDPKGGLEVKCKSQKVHAIHMDNPQSLVKEHILQINGCMWVCEREWWDVMAYHPTLKPVIVRVEPDEKVFTALEEVMPRFLELIETKKQSILNKPVELPLSEMGYK